MEEAIQHLSQDKKFKLVLDSCPRPVPPKKDGVYQSLLRSILSQQLSVKAAVTIHGRFLELFHQQDPTPEELVNLSLDTLRSAGLSRQKGSYVQNVAAHFLQNDWMSRDWSQVSDERIIDDLTAIKGVGRWTAQMILMFSLNRPDIFPIDDLGIRQAMIKLYHIKVPAKIDRKEKKDLYQRLENIAAKWQPYRSVACRYLWQWYG